MIRVKFYGDKGLDQVPDSVGGYSYPHTFYNTTTTLNAGGSYAVSSSLTAAVIFTLPASPSDGDTYKICKATSNAFTVSVTSSTYPVNGGTTAVDLLTTWGTKEVQFCGSPINMWIAG